MSPAVLVATILALGWNFVLAITAVLTETGPFRPDTTDARTMQWSSQTVRAEVGALNFDARASARKAEVDGGTAEHVQSAVSDTSRTTDVEVGYADASVTVMTDDGPQMRHCSVCMN